jgi:hypothetical protein
MTTLKLTLCLVILTLAACSQSTADPAKTVAGPPATARTQPPASTASPPPVERGSDGGGAGY